MADRLRQMAQRLKEKLQFPLKHGPSKDKMDQIITKYVPAAKMTEMAEQFKHEAITKRVRDLVAKYEKFTGVQEIMALQHTVVEAQEKFIAAQDRRRELGRELANIEARLKELHAEMQNTMKGDEKYLHLCTEEHKLIIQERALRTHFSEAEREERELFATMSAAVKLGHERERAHAERNKYWYIVASIFGTVLGIAGSTINNHLKMSEFRNMMEQQMARSASVLYTIAGGGGGGTATERPDIADAMKTEFAYQEQLAENLREMKDNINHLVDKQTSLIDHLHRQDQLLEKQMKELKKMVVAASQTSAKSDAELAQILSAVHHDLDEVEKDKEDAKNRPGIDSNQILTGIGIIICAALIFGNIIGRVS